MEQDLVQFAADNLLLFSVITFVAFLLLWIVIRSRPPHKARRLIRRALKRKDQPEEALELLDAASRIDPQNNYILHTAASIAISASYWGRAIEYLQRLEARGELSTFQRIQLGGALSLTERYHESIALLQGVEETNPYFVKALYITGLAFYELQDYESAIATYKRGPLRKRKLDGDLMNLHYGLAQALEAIGKHEEAKRHYRRVYVVDINYRDVSTKVG